MTASAVLDGGPAAMSERTFPCLDGARIVAATAVVLTHVGFATGTSSSGTGIGATVLHHLQVGVAVFFVLSGFLLFRPFPLAAARGLAVPDAGAYLWRRALRILPAYWLTVVAALLFLPENDEADSTTLLRHLALVQLYDDKGTVKGLDHLWSLCTEVAFYAVLPLLAVGLIWLSRNRASRPWPALMALGGLAVAGPVFVYYAWLWRVEPYQSNDWLPAYAGWFAGGMAMALLTAADPDWGPARAARALGRHLVLCWAVAGALFAVACTPLSGPSTYTQPEPGEAVVQNVLYMGIAVLLVLPLVLGQERGGLARRALSSPTARFLGEISYGLFLVHMLLLRGLYTWLNIPFFTGEFIPVLVLIWGSSVAVATGLYFSVERPLSRFRTLVADRSRKPVEGRIQTPVIGDLAAEPTK